MSKEGIRFKVLSIVFRTVASLGLMLAVFSPQGNAKAASLTVDSLLNVTNNADGVCTIREAIINANNDAATWTNCAAGSGADVIVFSVSGTIVLTSSLPTITDVDGLTIDGGGTITISGNNIFRIVTVNANVPATLQNMTLTAGNGSNGDGGAIDNNGGNLTVTNVTFLSNNTTGAGDDGGAIYNRNTGTLNVLSSTFTNNRASAAGASNGGAILSTGGVLTIANSSFTNNSTSNNGGAVGMSGGTTSISESTFTSNAAATDGGAVFISGGVLSVTDSTFSTNSSDDGGAIFHNTATLLTVTGSTFTGNLASGEADGDGGAIVMNSATAGASLTLDGSTFSDNIANDDGGAIWINAEPVSITSSVFGNNRAQSGNAAAEGGAIYNSANADSTSIRLSTFTTNTVAATANVNAYGGAISNYGAAFILANDTFTGNAVTKSAAAAGNARGGAVWSNAASTIHNVTFNGNSVAESGTGTADGGSLYRNGGAVTVANTILANSTENGTAGNCGGTITNGGNNIHFNGADCPATFTNTNPGLGALTGTPAYFPLNLGSPAIGAGNNATCATVTSTNNQSQNGATRPQPVAGNCDVGSFEYQNQPPTDIALSNNTIDENQISGTLVGMLTTTDVDDTTFTYSLVDTIACTGPDNASFQIGGVAGDELQSGAIFDYETTTSYTVCIRTTDGAGNTYDEQFTVNVNDINEPPVDIALSNNAIDENQAVNTVIGTLSASDPDAGASFTFSLACSVPGADDASFNINGSDLRFSVPFDFETQSVFNICVRVTDQGGLTYDEIFSINVNDLDDMAPSVTVEQAGSDPTNISPVDFLVTFSEPIDLTSFTEADFTLSGTAGATTVTITQIAPGDGTTFNVSVSGMTGSGTVVILLGPNVLTDLSGNGNQASTSVDNTVTFDINYPVVVFGVNTAPANSASLTNGPVQITIEFSRDIKNDGSPGAANTLLNYLLVEGGNNSSFETVSCAPPGFAATDLQIAINAASYTNNGGSGPFVATLSINGGIALPDGRYRLFVCGTTSIEDLIGNELNNGLNDTIIDFTVQRAGTGGNQGGVTSPTALGLLPATGFPQGLETVLPVQSAELAYASYPDLWLEIPKLSLEMPIVGVPQTKDGWNVTWLNRDAGWLNGSAFPTWNGNSVITAHVWDALNQPGPFASLKNLRYGDQFKIHAFGQVYVYEIRESRPVSPNATLTVFKHEEKSWITLVTCEDYRERSQTYSYRRMVRAVLVSVTKE